MNGVADEREQIKERLPIETLVGERVALQRAGRNLKGLCPFHKEKTPSFVVSPERGTFHCFGCNAGGDIFRFYMLLNKVEFPEALQALAARTGIELDPEAARRKASEARAYDVLQAVSLYFQQALMATPGKDARDYLAGRGITQTTIERFALGYLPDWGEGMRRDLPARGISVEDLLSSGILVASDQGREPFCAFHGRLIFPIRDERGRVCGFGGRILGDGQPKYLNSRQTALFDKSAVLYTIDRAAETIRTAHEAVIVEGYMDALRAHQDGFTNVIASLGTAITVGQLTLLSRLRGRDAATIRTVLALDADPAGARAAAEAGVRALVATRSPKTTGVPTVGRAQPAPLDLCIAALPEGYDPDELIAESPERWRQTIAAAKPAMDHLFDLVLGGLDRRLPSFTQDLLAQLLPLIGQLPAVGQQQPYLERLQTITHIETAALRGELARLRGEARRSARQPTTRQSEIAALRQAVKDRDPREAIESELLAFVLQHMPLDAQALQALENLPFQSTQRGLIVEAVLAVHGSSEAPSVAQVRRLLGPDVAEVLDSILEGPLPPPVERHKAATAIRVYRSRLERLEQGRRLREQGALLDQVDSQTARELLGPTRDLIASRQELNRRMLEEQSKYHLQ